MKQCTNKLPSLPKKHLHTRQRTLIAPQGWVVPRPPPPRATPERGKKREEGGNPKPPRQAQPGNARRVHPSLPSSLRIFSRSVDGRNRERGGSKGNPSTPQVGGPLPPQRGNRTHGGEFHKAQCSEIQTGRSLKVERVFEVQTAKLLPSRPNKFCFVTANGRGLQVACFCSLNGLRPKSTVSGLFPQPTADTAPTSPRIPRLETLLLTALLWSLYLSEKSPLGFRLRNFGNFN